MPSSPAPEIAVTGIGVASGLGHGKASLIDGLLAGRDVFSVLARPGRQAPDGTTAFMGVEMPDPPELLPRRVARTAGFSARVAIAVLDEAWREAGLDDVDPERIGLVVGGSNLFSREQLHAVHDYANRQAFIPPRHGHVFLDSDLCGLCASTFAIRGFANTVGAASASGAVAILLAAEAVRCGRVDACIALGAMQDVSYVDLLGFRALGALGAPAFDGRPGKACRPFDAGHDGFLYGESCAALVLRRADAAGQGPGYGILAAAAQVADGRRGPEPDPEGQRRAIACALEQAGLRAADIDYVNAHATGTPKGDEVELATLRAMGLEHAWVNATKSVIGHGLSAAGAVELAAVLLQMRAAMLHPTRNLDRPLEPGLRYVVGAPQPHRVCHALKLSFGFGGVDTALIVRAPGGERS